MALKKFVVVKVILKNSKTEKILREVLTLKETSIKVDRLPDSSSCLF